MVTFDAVVDLGEGALATLPICAEDLDHAWAKARSVFPGRRLMLVAREPDDNPEPSGQS